jgi:ABC-type molybdate transport system permease subunit
MSPACRNGNAYRTLLAGAGGEACAATRAIPTRMLTGIDVTGRTDLAEVLLAIIVLISLLVIGG